MTSGVRGAWQRDYGLGSVWGTGWRPGVAQLPAPSTPSQFFTAYQALYDTMASRPVLSVGEHYTLHTWLQEGAWIEVGGVVLRGGGLLG